MKILPLFRWLPAGAILVLAAAWFLLRTWTGHPAQLTAHETD